MESTQKDLYFVAVKVFLRDKNKLLITHDIFGAWDLPGGRIRVDEFNKPLVSVVARKVEEELGSKVRYKLGEPNGIFFRVERIENSTGQLVRIFAIGYDGEYLGGQLQLGDHHDKMEWVDVDKFDPKQYFEGGWLVGVQEYINKLNFKETPWHTLMIT